ncbi:MAG TPA: efflux RND transporter periplasmic adaptor subunit [Burkholderiaceae bacterium]|nr:efflux RND transporter periplasmic adaptor subunit [Burkholderiaceae bacterium]
MRRYRILPRLGQVAVATMMLALAGCKEQAPPPPPPFEVGVVTVHPQSVAVTTELPGRTSPYLVAQVRARVTGIVLNRDFREGSRVKVHQSLFKIDAAPYKAALDAAKATLQKAEANLTSTTLQANRYKLLVASHAVSSQDYANAVAAQKQAAADVAGGKASVEIARINLDYTDVTSPIAGIIGASDVTPGAYVQSSAATLMATVQQIDPIYVDLTQSTTDVMRMRGELADGRMQSAGPNEAKVQLVLDNGSVYPLAGRLEFTDITVDPSTGSVKLRALFPNPQHLLLPGMFVRARLREGINDRAILVPEAGVTHDAKGAPTALVVGPDDKVELRNLVANRIHGADWVVDSGLNPGDRVIVAGIQKVRPGMTVRAVEQPTRSMAASTARGPASMRLASVASR